MRYRRSFILAAALALGACAGQTMSFSSLYITGNEIREKGAESAYDVVVNHRELIVVAGDVAFRGGYDLDGESEHYFRPVLLIDGNQDLGDVTTELRRIKAEEIARIRLIRASQVPPEERRPGTRGGIIEITTINGVGSRS